MLGLFLNVSGKNIIPLFTQYNTCSTCKRCTGLKTAFQNNGNSLPTGHRTCHILLPRLISIVVFGCFNHTKKRTPFKRGGNQAKVLAYVCMLKAMHTLTILFIVSFCSNIIQFIYCMGIVSNIFKTYFSHVSGASIVAEGRHNKH